MMQGFRTKVLASGASVAACAAIALGGSVVVAPNADAATRIAEIRANVLVLDDGQPMVAAVKDRLRKEGVPFTTLDLTSSSRARITSSYLVSDTLFTLRGQYMGVVAPDADLAALSDSERSTLAAYEKQFKVREFVAYTWANPSVGLNYAANPGYVGKVDGMKASVTQQGRTPFAYLAGNVTLDDLASDVDESYGYVATPLPATATQSFTPLVTTTIPGTQTEGSLLGVQSVDGRERLISTFASNAQQQHWKVLSHGVVSWLTRGMSTSYSRNFLSVHIDDILLPDAEWSAEGNCTIGDGCSPTTYPEDAPGATSRMTPSDVDHLVAWQAAHGVKLDMVFNAGGTAEYKADHGSDALESALLAKKADLRWINHTYSHPYLGCVQDYSTTPWQCAKTSTGEIQWASRVKIVDEISKNIAYATAKALPNFDRRVLVTGEHSGLRTLPQMPNDNPNLAGALTNQGIAWVASDASRESTPRTVGSATTVPRHPMNIFYNTSTKALAADEYNWIYTSRANGGSGLCEDNPTTSTCIEPLGADGFDGYIVPKEQQIAMGHVVDNDAMPHYAHQSNLTNDRILYPVLDGMLAQYGALFAADAPVVNPTMQEAGAQMVRQAAWAEKAGSVTATIRGNQFIVTNPTWSRVDVPMTMPAGSTSFGLAFGSRYGGQNSAWVTLGAFGSRTVTMPGVTGFATTTTWPAPAPASVPAVRHAPASFDAVATRSVDLNDAVTSVVATGH